MEIRKSSDDLQRIIKESTQVEPLLTLKRLMKFI